MTHQNKMAAHLQAHGVRPTRQRFAIAQTLFKGAGRHIDASGLYEELTNTSAMVSLATVYNALQAFDRAGLVRRVALPGECAWYDTDTQITTTSSWWQKTGLSISMCQMDRKRQLQKFLMGIVSRGLIRWSTFSQM